MTDIAQLSIKCDSTDLGKAKDAMGGLTGAAGVLESYIGKLAAAWAAWKVTQHVAEVATLAARYETMGVVMAVAGNNAGYTAKEMETLEKQMQATGISMLGARETLTSLATANIDLANATKLARTAQDLAVVGNVNSTEAFQRLVQGIKSGQTETLRTLGLNMQFEEGYRQLASSMGKTVEQLSGQEKVQARANQVLAASVRYQGIYEAAMSTTGKQMLSMERYVENLKIKLGELFGPALSTGVQTLTEWLKEMKNWLDRNAESAELVKENLASAAKNFVGIVQDAGQMLGAEKGIVEDLGIMEILSGGLALSFAFIRDVIQAIYGAVKMVVGLFETALEPLARISAYLLGLANIKAPAWLENISNWGGIDRIKEGFGDFNPKNTVAFYSPDTSNAVKEAEALAEAKKKMAEAERARIEAAKQANAADAAAGVAAERARKEAEATKELLKARDSMVAKLREEEATWGMTTAQIRRYKAEQLGLGGSQALKDLEALEKIRRDDIAASEREAEAADSLKAKRGEAFRERQGQLEYEQNAIQAADDYMSPYMRDLEQLGTIYEGLAIKLERGAISQAEFNRAEADLIRMAKKDMPVVTETFGDLRDTIADWASSSTDALTEFCLTGKSSFSDLVDSMIRDLVRLAIQKNITEPLFYGSGGDGGGGLGGLIGYVGGLFGGGGGVADGTPANSGSWGTWDPPVSTSASPVTSSVTVNISQSGAVDAKSSADGGNSGAALGKQIESAVVAVLAKHQRPGGMLQGTR